MTEFRIINNEGKVVTTATDPREVDMYNRMPDDPQSPYAWHPDDEGAALAALNILSLPPLSPLQFDAVLRLLGIDYGQIEAAIDAAISNPAMAAVAKAKLHKSEQYHRTNELFALVGPALDKTDDEINIAWAMAASIA